VPYLYFVPTNTCDSVRRRMFCMTISLVTAGKLDRFIKMCLNKTSYKFCTLDGQKFF
jgi:hypothetical protein